MSRIIAHIIESGSQTVKVIAQDDFYLEMDSVKRIWKEGDPTIRYYDYDSVQSVNERGLLQAIESALSMFDFVVVEGNLLTEMTEVHARLDHIVFVTLDYPTCQNRRRQRCYIPPDQPGYFDQVVWPSYEEHLKQLRDRLKDCSERGDLEEIARFTFLDGSLQSSVLRAKLMSLVAELSKDAVRLQETPINVQESVDFVSGPGNGAVSIFLGTTRNNFEGKKVLRLEYEAYPEMAYKELRLLCAQVHHLYPNVDRISIVHRLGLVPTGEASVLIACSSPHRRAAITATEWAIEELKRTVPIWKKEIYDDDSSSWKANAECISELRDTSAPNGNQYP